jgi:Ras family
VLWDKRQVSSEEGRKLASDWGCSWVESSARDGSNVDKIFELMVLEVEKSLNPRARDHAFPALESQPSDLFGVLWQLLKAAGLAVPCRRQWLLLWLSVILHLRSTDSFLRGRVILLLGPFLGGRRMMLGRVDIRRVT